MDNRAYLKALLRGLSYHVAKIRVYDTQGGKLMGEIEGEVINEALQRGLIAGKDVDKCKMKPISIKDGIALMSERDCDGMEDIDIFCCGTNEDVERAKAFIENRKKEQWEHL